MFFFFLTNFLSKKNLYLFDSAGNSNKRFRWRFSKFLFLSKKIFRVDKGVKKKLLVRGNLILRKDKKLRRRDFYKIFSYDFSFFHKIRKSFDGDFFESIFERGTEGGGSVIWRRVGRQNFTSFEKFGKYLGLRHAITERLNFFKFCQNFSKRVDGNLIKKVKKFEKNSFNFLKKESKIKQGKFLNFFFFFPQVVEFAFCFFDFSLILKKCVF